MSDDIPINTTSIDYVVDERIRNKLPPRENYIKNFQKQKVVTDHVPLPDTEATENRSWTINEIERVVATETLAPSKFKLDQFGLNENRKNDFRLRSLSRRLSYQLQRQFRRDLTQGPEDKRLKSFDIQSQTLRMIQANAALGTYQFQRTQTLPFMRKTLALDYQKITLLKKVVGGISSMEKAIVSKLEAIKMNTAAVLPQKQGLLSRLRQAIVQKNIDHVASNISNFQIEGWHDNYEKYVSPRLAKLHQKIKTPGKHTGINAIPNYVSRKLNNLRHLTARISEETPVAGSTFSEVRQKAGQAATKLLDGATKYSQKLRFSEDLNNRLGKVASMVTDPLQRIKPFAPITQAVRVTSDGVPGLLDEDLNNTPSLTETLLNDVRKSRLETNKHYKLLREDVHAIRTMMQDYSTDEKLVENDQQVLPKLKTTKSVRVRVKQKPKSSRLLEEFSETAQDYHPTESSQTQEGSTAVVTKSYSKKIRDKVRSISRSKTKPIKSKIMTVKTVPDDGVVHEVSPSIKTKFDDDKQNLESPKPGKISTSLSKTRKSKLKTTITPKQQVPISVTEQSLPIMGNQSVDYSPLMEEVKTKNEKRQRSLSKRVKESVKAKINQVKENEKYKSLTDTLLKRMSSATAVTKIMRPGSNEERLQMMRDKDKALKPAEARSDHSNNKTEETPKPASDLNLTAGVSAALGAAGGYVLRKTGGLALNTTKGLLYRGGQGVGATIGRTVNKTAIGAVKGAASLGLNATKGLLGLEAKGVGGLVGQIGNAGVRGATSLAGKTITGAIGLLGRGGLSILKSGFGLGLGLAVGQYAYNKVGIKNKALNRTVNTGFSAAQGALVGASIGGFFGGIGALPGAAIGGLAGAALENTDYISKVINKGYGATTKFMADLLTGNKKPDNQLNRNPLDPSKPYNPLDINQVRERYYQDNPDKRPPGYRPPTLNQTPTRSPDASMPQVTNYDSSTGRFSNLNYGTPPPENASRKKAQLTKGGIKDQPEFKSALNKLPKNIQQRILKSNALQFTLWATAIQHGPDMASKIFQRDYSDTLDDKSLVRSIYQDRAQQFSNLNYKDKLDANQQLMKEQNTISSFDRGYKANRQDMIDLFSNVVDTNSVTDGGLNTNYKPQKIQGSTKELAQRAMKFFMSKNYTKIAAAGIVGNLMEESSLQPHGPAGDGGKAIGIAQWHPSRRRNIANYFGKSVENMNFEEQLAAVDWEIRNGKGTPTNKPIFDELNRATDVGVAARTFMNKFEAPAERFNNGIKRTRYAMDVLATVSGSGTSIPQTSPDSSEKPTSNVNNVIKSPSTDKPKSTQVTSKSISQQAPSQNHDQLIKAFAEHAKVIKDHTEAIKAPPALQKPSSSPSMVVAPSIFTNNSKATTMAISMKKSQVAVGEF